MHPLATQWRWSEVENTENEKLKKLTRNSKQMMPGLKLFELQLISDGAQRKRQDRISPESPSTVLFSAYYYPHLTMLMVVKAIVIGVITK